jgi:hypothetical protein
MPTLRINGVAFETDAPLNVEQRFDGYNSVGHGMLVPVADRLVGGTGYCGMWATGA